MVKKDDNIHYKKVEIVILYVLCSKLIQSNKSIGNYSKKGFPGLFG